MRAFALVAAVLLALLASCGDDDNDADCIQDGEIVCGPGVDAQAPQPSGAEFVVVEPARGSPPPAAGPDPNKCAVICSVGKACGDSCINRELNCSQPAGRACNLSGTR